MQRAMADARAAAGDGMFGKLTSAERRILADLLGKVSAKEGRVDGQLDGRRAR
jgi:hypothetical protein